MGSSRQKHAMNEEEAEPESRTGASAKTENAGSKKKDPPPALTLKGLGRGRVAAVWDMIVGTYYRLDEDFNERAAYRTQAGDTHFLFWSQYGDWKLAERLKDDGVCIAYAEGPHGRHPPWGPSAPWWRIYDPVTRRFIYRRLSVRACKNGKSGPAREKEEDEQSSDDDDEEVPWGRGQWSSWTTADLLRWCKRHSIDVRGCFDRESVLECIIAAKQASESAQHRSGHPRAASDTDSESEDDSDDSRPRRRGKRGRGKKKQESRLDFDVQVASRMKTDGSYTRKPSLDPRVSLYGNRVEHFCGEEDAVVPWLYRFGDKSRLYGVFIDGGFGYSLVWKKQKYWGRVTYKSGRRE